MSHPVENYASEILNQLPPLYHIDFCDISDLAVPNIYPLLFKTNVNMGNNLKYVESNRLGHIKRIQKYLKSKTNLILPKYIQLHHCDGTILYIGPKFTQPSKRDLGRYGMILKETESSFIIERIKKGRLDPSEASDPLTEQVHEQVPDPTFSPIHDVAHDMVESEVVDMPTQDLLTPSELASIVNGEDVEDGEDDEGERANQLPDEGDNVHVRFAASSIAANYTSITNGSEAYNDLHSIQSEPHSSRTLDPNIGRYKNMFLNPEKLSNESFIALIHITKSQFLEFCEELKQYLPPMTDLLSLYSRAFLFRLRLGSCWTQSEISAVFGIPESTGRNIFWQVLKTYYENMVNIPNFLLNDDIVEQVYQDAYDAQDIYYTELVKLFPDPKNLGRKPVVILTDATYQKTKIPKDSQLQKLLFFEKGGGHVLKAMTFCTTNPKVKNC